MPAEQAEGEDRRGDQHEDHQPVGQGRKNTAADTGDLVVEHHVLRSLELQVLAVVVPDGLGHQGRGAMGGAGKPR